MGQQQTYPAFAAVALDIAARAFNATFDYGVPAELAAEVEVGTTVLVPFSGRVAIGYVMGVSDVPPEGLQADKIRAIAQVLAPSAFDSHAAATALWMSREYAAPLADVAHLYLAPGQKVRVTRKSKDDPWELVCERAGAVDARWAHLLPEGYDYEPPARASRQRQVLEALRQGPARLAELAATIPGAGAAVKSLANKGLVEVVSRREVRGVGETSLSSGLAPRPQTLTQGQTNALDAIDQARVAGAGDVVVVDGVTGSGKTEVYLQAIEKTLAAGRGAIVLVPEISLTAQTVARFRNRFGQDVAVLHSRLSTGERYDQWDMARLGQARVVVGARSALFAPVRDVGLIIIDEEHEGSYKQDSAPRYHAREVAAHMARELGCALVLGSATPSVESLERCREGRFRGASWTRVEMPERPGTAQLPEVQVVDMAEAFRGGGRSVFSPALADALREVAERREKAVLLLNRRGFATFLMCRECGCVPECPHCSTSLTYHERTHSLMCHSCGRVWPVRAYPDPTTSCPNCHSRYLAAYGVGTQRVEDELALLLGDGVEIVRMDADTTRTKGAHQELLERFDAAECAVLVGTQMIAKGLDFPEVTLVGVVNADTMLKLADFRAAEKTYGLLEQVAGRAGRGERRGRVIIQTYWPTHPAIQAAKTHSREAFLASELAERQDASYPPFSRLSNVVIWGVNERAVRELTTQLAADLRKCVPDNESWEVLGPADCIKAKIQDRVRRHVMLKSPPDSAPGEMLLTCVSRLKVPQGINIAIDVDAYDIL